MNVKTVFFFGFALAATGYSFDPLQHLAGIAPYFEPEDPPTDPAPPQGCTVERAAYLVRHAAIEANDFDYETYLGPFFGKLSNTSVNWGLTSPDLAFLSTWKSPISEKDGELLTRDGKLEATQLGVDLSYRYPNLRIPPRVWASTAERTVKSAQALIRGLEPDDNQINLVQIQESKKGGANTLTPYSSCSAYSTTGGTDQSNQFTDVYAAPILSRLRSQAPGFNWTANDVVAMQQLCGYETVIRGSSPFCSTTLFSPNEWLGFEYANDLKYYYNLGYGDPLAGVIGFPWLNATMGLLTADSSSQDLYVSFTHREFPPTVAVALGLFNNSGFSGDANTNDSMPLNIINHRRTWKSSNILPFLGNVGIERLNCSGSYGYDELKQSSGNIFYRTLWSNSPQQLPGCIDGPGESCSASGLQAFLSQRSQLLGGYSRKCAVNYPNTTDLVTFYTDGNNGTSVGK